MGSTCLPGLCPIATTTICIPPETGQDCPKQDPIPTPGPLSPPGNKRQEEFASFPLGTEAKHTGGSIQNSGEGENGIW